MRLIKPNKTTNYYFGTLFVWYLLFLILPLLLLVIKLFNSKDGPAIIWNVLGNSLYWQIIFQTIIIALQVTAVVFFVSIIIVWIYDKSTRACQKVLEFCIFGPMAVSFLVKTYGFIILLQSQGGVNELLLSLGLIKTPLPFLYNRLGVVIIMAYLLLPYFIVPMLAALKSYDRRLKAVASCCGAANFNVFSQITLPHIIPGIVLGACLTLISAFGFYIVPALIGGPSDYTYSMIIDNLMTVTYDWQTASAISILGILSALAFVFIIITILSSYRFNYLFIKKKEE